jgi:hypothetical protein
VLDEKTIAEYESAVTGKVIELNTMHLPLSERDTYRLDVPPGGAERQRHAAPGDDGRLH